MPIHENKKEKYFQYGTKGKKYYYTNLVSKLFAYLQCLQQAKAIHASKYRRLHT